MGGSGGGFAHFYVLGACWNAVVLLHAVSAAAYVVDAAKLRRAGGGADGGRFGGPATGKVRSCRCYFRVCPLETWEWVG